MTKTDSLRDLRNASIDLLGDIDAYLMSSNRANDMIIKIVSDMSITREEKIKSLKFYAGGNESMVKMLSSRISKIKSKLEGMV